MMKPYAIAFCLSLALALPAVAAGEGKAVGVDPDAVSRRGGAETVLVVGADISVGDRVVTGATGRVQLLFADETRLVVGPRSTLEIETYLLNGNSANRFAVNALAGTFRFISGNSPKSAYSIDTPAASIAVRGTSFDFTVARGQTQAILFSGALSMCRGNTCVELTRRCDIGVVGGSDTGLYTWPDIRRGNYVGNFPLPQIQSAFRPDFRVAAAQACLSAPQQDSNAPLTQSGSGQSGSTTPTSPTTPTTPGNTTP